MSRADDGSARAPGVPGPRGTEARGASTGGHGTLPSTPHRPVTAAFDGAGASAAAPSNRGDNQRAAAGAHASPLAPAPPKPRATGTAAPPGAALVLDSQRSVTGLAKRCPNRRIGIRLKSGKKLESVSCKRRDCSVCGPRKARELARVLILDAQVDCPTHGMTLTTQDPDISPATFRNGVAAVFKRLRRHYGRSVEYFGMVEFTSGQGSHSGGRRRIHQHILLKGLPAHADVLDVGRDVRETWRASTGATRVEVAELRTPGGALGYLALHHKKPKQAPPPDWHGMVERHSLRYFHRPIAELREQAPASFKSKPSPGRPDCPRRSLPSSSPPTIGRDARSKNIPTAVSSHHSSKPKAHHHAPNQTGSCGAGSSCIGRPANCFRATTGRRPADSRRFG